ncbi:MAG: DmsC/YnfH family molybdoenzyme membrane anchor subunit [Usitatibacteraceae bacterium]
MRPALSVIFFTVSSGAGLGLLVWLVVLTATGFAGGPPVAAFLPMLALGVILTTAGLMSSTLHLANPKNAWRAFSRVRTSWLSREGVLAIALYPVAAIYAGLVYSSAPATFSILAGGLLAILALGVLFCTGMIYACLKTIPRWHTRLVPVGYVALGLYSGALAALPLMALYGGDVSALIGPSLWLLGAALLVKAIYYQRFRIPVVQHTINAALPLGSKTIRLLDVGHTHGTFLTDEFCFVLARGHAAWLRLIALICGFGLPLLILSAGANGVAATAFTFVVCAAGLLAERWLFFAEAQHVVRLYHGGTGV